MTYSLLPGSAAIDAALATDQRGGNGRDVAALVVYEKRVLQRQPVCDICHETVAKQYVCLIIGYGRIGDRIERCAEEVDSPADKGGIVCNCGVDDIKKSKRPRKRNKKPTPSAPEVGLAWAYSQLEKGYTPKLGMSIPHKKIMSWPYT